MLGLSQIHVTWGTDGIPSSFTTNFSFFVAGNLLHTREALFRLPSPSHVYAVVPDTALYPVLHPTSQDSFTFNIFPDLHADAPLPSMPIPKDLGILHVIGLH